jgi:hypothetical protein
VTLAPSHAGDYPHLRTERLQAMTAVLAGLLPYAVFSLTLCLVGTQLALGLAALAAGALVARDWASAERPPKDFELATLVFLSALWAFGLFEPLTWEPAAARLVVDGGLLCIALLSLALHRPFTRCYAPNAGARVHRRTAGIWTGAFAVLVLGDVSMLLLPWLPLRVAEILPSAALALAAGHVGPRARRTT